MKFKSTQDLSALENFNKQVVELTKERVEYGYFDTPHYSGLNMATLAFYHEYGGKYLPERNFMYSTSFLFKDKLHKHLRSMYKAMVAGKNFRQYLKAIGKSGAEQIQYTISQGAFSNNKVSKDWAAIKGFDDALVHYGDLRNAASYKIVKAAKAGK